MEKDRVVYEIIESNMESPFCVRVFRVPIEELNHVVEKHWHRSIEFIVTTGNESQTWIEGRYYTVTPENFLCVNSRFIHECQAIYRNVPYHGYSIQLKYNYLLKIVPDINRLEFKTCYDSKIDVELLNILNNIVEVETKRTQNKELKLRSLALDLMYVLLNNYIVQNRENTNKTKNRTKILTILNYLDQHFDEPYDAYKVAEHFDVSYSYLAKFFKIEVGMSMKEYINILRVRKSRFDLLSTDLPIIDIAMLNGFANANAFYQEFEKIFHMTPKQYRLSKKGKKSI